MCRCSLAALICLVVCVSTAQKLYNQQTLSPLIFDILQEMGEDFDLPHKRGFAFHAARGKKSDPDLEKRYAYVPSRGRRST